MRILRTDEMKSLIDMKDVISWIETAMKILSSKKAEVPLRTRIETEKGVILFMPAFSKDLGNAGQKIVSVFPDNVKIGKPPVPATMVLISGETGEVISLMDGTFLTKVRTGAVQGVSTKYLSREDSKIALLIGCGSQAESQVSALLSVRDIEKLYVFDIDRERAERLSRKVEGTRCTVVDDPNEVVGECDIIISVTTSKKPVFDGKRVREGTHVVGVGSFTPDMQEIDEKVVEKARKVFVDTKEGVLNESGDVMIPLKKGMISESDVIELGEVILGKVEGRRSYEEVTFFKTVGSAIFDLVVAQRIYERALERNVGSEIEL